MGKTLTNMNQYISTITDIDEKWFVIFEHIYISTTFLLAMFVYPNLSIISLVLHLFFLVSFSSSAAIYFLTAKRTVFKV